MKKVIFICLGNICRSPGAEAVFRSIVAKESLEDKIEIDSAGIIGYHSGEHADHRMMKHTLKRGYQLGSISRQFNPKTDFDRFDYIVGMDDENISDLIRLSRNESDRKKIYRMAQFLTRHDYKYIPDPYYSGQEGFELVIDLLEDGCEGLLKKVQMDI